jgi:hypothetical protein
MTVIRTAELPADAVGLCLYRIVKDELIGCEAIRFDGGRAAVDTVLRRAGIAGRVDIGGEVQDHFADVLNDNQDLVETVALDRHSYAALKNKWMRCKVARLSQKESP